MAEIFNWNVLTDQEESTGKSTRLKHTGNKQEATCEFVSINRTAEMLLFLQCYFTFAEGQRRGHSKKLYKNEVDYI